MRARVLWLALAAAVLPAPVSSQSFDLLTQNLKRFGISLAEQSGAHITLPVHGITAFAPGIQ